MLAPNSNQSIWRTKLESGLCSTFGSCTTLGACSLHEWFRIPPNTVCPKVHGSFEVTIISLICWPILNPFAMVNPHILRFCLVYNIACHVLLTPHEHGITFDEMLKSKKRMFFYKCLWTPGHHEFWEKFYSWPPSEVPLTTACHERRRMKRKWHLTPVRQSKLQPTA